MIIGDCKPGVLKAHQCNMIYKWEIAGEPPSGSQKPRGSNGVQHHSNFYALSSVFQFQNSKYRLIECPLRLDHIVVNGIDGRIDGNSNHEVGVLHACPCVHYLRRSKRASITEYVN